MSIRTFSRCAPLPQLLFTSTSAAGQAWLLVLVLPSLRTPIHVHPISVSPKLKRRSSLAPFLVGSLPLCIIKKTLSIFYSCGIEGALVIDRASSLKLRVVRRGGRSNPYFESRRTAAASSGTTCRLFLGGKTGSSTQSVSGGPCCVPVNPFLFPFASRFVIDP